MLKMNSREREVDRSRFRLEDISRYRSELYGLSILWIMFFHAYTCYASYPKPLCFVLAYGNMGVEIFLFLSSICLYFSFEREKNLAVYARKRILRVGVPILLICYPSWIVLCGIGRFSVMGLLGRMSTLNFWLCGDQQIWFVSMILFLYILYPYFYYFIFGDGTKKPLAEFISMLLLIAVTILVLFIMRYQAADLYDNIEIGLTRVPSFLLGCWAGKYVKQKASFHKAWLLPGAVCVVVCFWALNNDLLHGMGRREWYLLGAIPLCFLLTSLFRLLKGTVINKFFAVFGAMSLELYLSHILIKFLYQHDYLTFCYREGSLKRYLLVLAISVVVAYVAYKINTLISPYLKRLLKV